MTKPPDSAQSPRVSTRSLLTSTEIRFPAGSVFNCPLGASFHVPSTWKEAHGPPTRTLHTLEPANRQRPEMIAGALCDRCPGRNHHHLHRTQLPCENPFVESSNSRARDEPFNADDAATLLEAHAIVEA